MLLVSALLVASGVFAAGWDGVVGGGGSGGGDVSVGVCSAPVGVVWGVGCGRFGPSFEVWSIPRAAGAGSQGRRALGTVSAPCT